MITSNNDHAIDYEIDIPVTTFATIRIEERSGLSKRELLDLVTIDHIRESFVNGIEGLYSDSHSLSKKAHDELNIEDCYAYNEEGDYVE